MRFTPETTSTKPYTSAISTPYVTIYQCLAAEQITGTQFLTRARHNHTDSGNIKLPTVKVNRPDLEDDRIKHAGSHSSTVHTTTCCGTNYERRQVELTSITRSVKHGVLFN